MQVIWKPLRFGVRPYRCYRCDVLAPMLCPNIVSTRTGLNKFLQRFHGGLPTLAGCWLASCLYIYIYIYIYIKLFFALFFLQLSSIAFVGILGNTGQAKGFIHLACILPTAAVLCNRTRGTFLVCNLQVMCSHWFGLMAAPLPHSNLSSSSTLNS